MSRKILILILPFLLTILISCSSDSDIIIEEEALIVSSEVSEMEKEILDLVNDYRSTINKPALSFNNVAIALANDHTNYMISKNKISHDNFNERFEQLAQNTGAKTAAENVASGNFNAQSVVDAWIESDGHRKNIEGDFTHIGIAAVQNNQNRYYFTQIFYK